MNNITPRLKINKATLDDVDAISSLTDAAYSKWIPVISRKPQPMTADYSKMVVENSIWLLYVEEQLAGVLVLVDESTTVLIYSIAVHPAYQKKGLGRRLLDWAEHQAREKGYTSIRLYTNEQFNENIRLYHHAGYEETGREPFLNSNIIHLAKKL